MGVYGIDYFAGSRFGRDPAIVRPDFSVAPFKSMPLNYTSLQLTWNRPPSKDCTQLQLVRNFWNVPQDETDGFLLFPAGWNEVTHPVPPVMDALGMLTQYQPVGNQVAFVDINAQPGFNYYSMFGWDSVNHLWIRCTDLIAILPVNYNQGDTLYNLLPGCYRDLDMVLVEPYNPWSKTYYLDQWAFDTSPPLERYLNLIGFQLDFIRTEADGLLNVNNADLIDGALLPLLGYQLGMITEPEIGMQQERALIGNAIHLYKLKGSSRGITEFSAMLTSYPTMLAHKGYNLLLTRDDSVGETSIGTWQAAPAWGVWNTHLWSTLWSPPNPLSIPNTNLGLQLTPVHLYDIPLIEDPIGAFPSDADGNNLFPADTLNPPYGAGGDADVPTGIAIYVEQACTVDIHTGGIPTLDFLSETDQPGNITWELQLWNAAQNPVELSVWGDDGSGVPISVVAPQGFTTAFEEWSRFRVTGPVVFSQVNSGSSDGTAFQNFIFTGPYNGREIVKVNGVIWKRAPGNRLMGQAPDAQVYVITGVPTHIGPPWDNLVGGIFGPPGQIVFGDGVTGAIPPVDAFIEITYGHYDFMHPRLVIRNMAAGQTVYMTLACAWATVPDNIGTFVPYYDYPRDIKVTLEPQAANLMANPLTTFEHGQDGWGCTSNEPLIINNVADAQEWSFEGGTVSGFTPGPNTVIANSSIGAEDGLLCLAMTAESVGDISAVSPVAELRLAWGSNDAGGTQYQCRTNFQSNSVSRPCQVTFGWFDLQGTPLGTSVIGPRVDNSTSGSYVTGQITAPPGAVYLGAITPYVSSCGPGETHYVDDIWVGGLPIWGTLSTPEMTTGSVPHGTGVLQVDVIQAPSTVWGGTVTQFSPPAEDPAGWFVDPYQDWFGGNRFGTTKVMDWFQDPVTKASAWSFLGGQYFGIANSWMGGNWFPQLIIAPSANLVGFEAFPAQWLNFSIYAACLTAMGSEAEMQFGFRWYYPDDTWIEQILVQDLSGLWDRYPYKSVLLTGDLIRYDVTSEAPFQEPSGNPPMDLFVYCRFPQANAGDLFQLNSALLSMGPHAPPFDDATLHPGSPDWIIDERGASFYYRRRTPRTARLRAEMYRWIPMGATYSLLFGSAMTEPPYDPTVWPP